MTRLHVATHALLLSGLACMAFSFAGRPGLNLLAAVLFAFAVWSAGVGLARSGGAR